MNKALKLIDEELNIELRSEVLVYSLQLEKNINDLVLINLGIYDDTKKTRLFGSNSKITFKNKIDLLYDIDVLTNEENLDLELLMNFRNKFLHVIECDSFTSIINNFDKGLRNRFKVFLNSGETIENEEACRNALRNLHLKNIRTIRDKVIDKLNKSNERHEIIQVLNQEVINYHEHFYSLTNDILLIVENSELENEKIKKLGKLISLKCIDYSNKLTNDKKFVELKKKHIEFFNDEDKVKNLYGIRRIDNKETNSLSETPNT